MPSASIDDIEAGLPNGLHDSRLHTFSAGAAEGRAEFVLDVWVGDLHSTVQKERERYRRARLELLGLGYLIIEDPDPRYGPAEKSPVQFDVCAADDDADRSRRVPEGGFAGRFFITDWNSYIHFAALEARLTWIDTN
jgi:hypothetical protein